MEFNLLLCFSGFFERLPLTEFRSDKKVRTIFEVRTIKSAYYIVCTSFMPLNRSKDKEHSRFIFAATLSALRR